MTTIKQDTGKVIAEMLKENTGRNLLDSGMIYGYGYDKRAELDYPKTPENFIKGGQYFKSTYHHLLDNLVVSNENEAFQKFARGEMMRDELEWELQNMSQEDGDALVAERIKMRQDEPWHETLDNYVKYQEFTANEGYNTYNMDNLLDVDFQWFEIDGYLEDKQFVVIRTHNGCDARGGYSTPVWFEYKDHDRDDSNLHSVDTGYMYCSANDEHRFETYDAYNWSNSDTGTGKVDIEEDANGNLLCPLCKGILQA